MAQIFFFHTTTNRFFVAPRHTIYEYVFNEIWFNFDLINWNLKKKNCHRNSGLTLEQISVKNFNRSLCFFSLKKTFFTLKLDTPIRNDSTENHNWPNAIQRLTVDVAATKTKPIRNARNSELRVESGIERWKW